MTVKNKYSLPRIDDLFDQLKGAQVFSKDRPEIRVLSIEDQGARCLENCFQNPILALQIPSDAIRVNQCSNIIH
jgi:hypothetical protein